ncbi:DNA polymerase IV [Salinicola rhizosphaerae]|uniref:DNA polymerase IV n=1 Tax=Salinicola rhizosphaerae TaxID=1443141 RepID=A0ABQ3DSF6_9GAMM|nr:DNA polymerase IV [Salinicola rhizosphaerae]GHB10547.1 DNA polymerase IV [Salinicola rhizosphaerae]
MTTARKILHADCDCFYAAVEMRDTPSLRDRPLAVGGSPERRGVIATCNYPARRFGVHSAMPSARALRLCPELRIVPPDFAKYRAVSQQIQAIFHELTPLVEPLSLDEAYLDVSEITAFRGSATWMARWIKEEALKRTGIVVSVGVAPNKFLAKIASDWDKPDGLFVIVPGDTESFITDLPVKKLHGVGPATARRLEELSIETCADLRIQPLERLLDHFGKFGRRLHELAHGIDERPVAVSRERKSVSVENTYHHDLPDLASCHEALAVLIENLDERMARHGNPAIGKQFIKVRFNDFTSTTQETGARGIIHARFHELLDSAWQRGSRPVRLLGVGVRLLPALEQRQLGLFDAASEAP